MADLVKNLRDAAEGVLVPGLRDQPERRYTSGGKAAHLLTYGIDYKATPYAEAWCGRSPMWSSAWYGSGSQRERDRADKLPTCKACLKVAREKAEEIAKWAGRAKRERA